MASTTSSTRRIVSLSGGLGSFGAARRVLEQFGPDSLTLLFADTLAEDPDLYRFLADCWYHLDVELVNLSTGKSLWQVFDEVDMIGNSRVDPCSAQLKRIPLRRWLEENCDPSTTVMYLGMDWDEVDRFERAWPYWQPWTVEAPNQWPPYQSKEDILGHLEAAGIRPPALYEKGFKHNNCGGFCVKAGQAQFARLLTVDRELYLYHELSEKAFNTKRGTDHSIMVDRRSLRPGEPRRPLTMEAFRKRLEAGGEYDTTDEGACSCVTPGPEMTE